MSRENTPLWEQLSDTADELACAGLVTKSTLQLLRAASVQMENWFVGNVELREENHAAIKRINEQDIALDSLADVFFHAAKFARHEITMDAFSTGVVDKSPFLNVMNARGLDSVGAPLRVRKKKVQT